MNQPEAQARYDTAMARFRAMSARHAEVIARYRARDIDDAAFVASRAIYDAAMKASDEAERALLESMGR